MKLCENCQQEVADNANSVQKKNSALFFAVFAIQKPLNFKRLYFKISPWRFAPRADFVYSNSLKSPRKPFIMSS